MVKLKRLNEAQLDLFGWENPKPTNKQIEEPPSITTKPKNKSSSKKVVKRSLPIKKYKIIDTWSTLDPETVCDNCGKAISNIAKIKSEDGKTYLVGMDCAATLSGITSFDIEYWNNAFKQAKAIRAKLRKFLKDGGTWKPFIPWYRPTSIISLLKYNPSSEGKLLPYYTTCWAFTPYVEIEKGNHFNSFQDIIKYLPDMARDTLINPLPTSSYLSTDNESDIDSIPNKSSTFKGFKIDFKPPTEDDLSYYIKIFKNNELWLGTQGKSYSNLSSYSKINKGQKMDIEEANLYHLYSTKIYIIRMLNVCLWYQNAIPLEQYLNTH